MRKVTLLVILLVALLEGCSSRMINGKEQTFAEYVILNKYSSWEGSTWAELDEECYPLLRLKKWSEKGE